MNLFPQINSPTYWDKQYGSGRIPWDLGGPTPVFERLARSGKFSPGRMIVLGAGQGHDARLFASHGFKVTANFAPQAVQAMRTLADEQAAIQIVRRDIFDLPPEFAGAFDYVLEYTCFCAIDPAYRRAYYDLIVRLLVPGGLYIALAFPIVTLAGGPPFAVTVGDLTTPLLERGMRLKHRERPSDSAHGRDGIEELLIMQNGE